MSDEQCPVCGETRLEGWQVCPACGHPYDEPDVDAEGDPDDDPDDDGEGAWWRA